MTNLLLMTDTISEGYLILTTGLIIVFCSLLTLSLFFQFGMPFMLYVYKIITKRKDKKIEEIVMDPDPNFSGELTAAIAAGIHMYLNEQHDYENPILTIKQAKKSYSPWSSKIYGTQNSI